MDDSTVAHIEQCWRAHQNKRRELNVVHDNLLRAILQALGEGASLEEIFKASGFALEEREAQCVSLFGEPHTHKEPVEHRFARWITQELGDFITRDPEVDVAGGGGR